MNQEISVEEIQLVIRKMKTNIAPGPGGYSIEIYKAFATLLIAVMKAVFNDILGKGNLSPSWSEARLIPIVKPGKDLHLCILYRSIALLNVDAKLFMLILASRWQNIIMEYINSDQMGFIPGKNYGR